MHRHFKKCSVFLCYVKTFLKTNIQKYFCLSSSLYLSYTAYEPDFVLKIMHLTSTCSRNAGFLHVNPTCTCTCLPYSNNCLISKYNVDVPFGYLNACVCDCSLTCGMPLIQILYVGAKCGILCGILLSVTLALIRATTCNESNAILSILNYSIIVVDVPAVPV